MKLANPDFHFIIDIAEDKFPVLVLEQSELFHRVMSFLFNQAEGAAGPFVLSDNWEPLDIGKTVIVLTDLFCIDLNGRKQLSALSKYLNATAVSEHHIQATYDLQDHILRWTMDLEEDLPFATIHNSTINIGSILKAAGIQFDDGITDLAERLCNYIKICAGFLHARLIVVNSLHSHLTEEKLNEVYRTAMYEKVSILDVERYIPDSKLLFEKYYIIDSDNCEIYNEL